MVREKSFQDLRLKKYIKSLFKNLPPKGLLNRTTHRVEGPRTLVKMVGPEVNVSTAAGVNELPRMRPREGGGGRGTLNPLGESSRSSPEMFF